jgi:hypothetical protein
MHFLAISLYGMHWQWYGMVWYALAMEMVCISIGNDNGNGMVCKIVNSNHMHWQWKLYELAMVCIGNVYGMHCLAIALYGMH